jgi:Raf kinase inhibitor-like YbhB/YbcL family protein
MRPRNFLQAGLIVSLTVCASSTFGIGADTSMLQISSTGWANGETIPKQFTCSGADHSPPLAWSGVPQGAKSLALLVDDPDAPGGTFVHWVVYNIPVSTVGFTQESSEGKEGINSTGKVGYMGPCPPPGTPHHYHFRLFALDTATINPGAMADADGVREGMRGHVKGNAELVGIFGR